MSTSSAVRIIRPKKPPPAKKAKRRIKPCFLADVNWAT